jgi:hypothetical protein
MPSVEEQSCRLSVVVTTRNDDFGSGMLQRLQGCADTLLALAERHGLDGELIVVEWNPPDGPRLHDSLQLAERSERFAIRFLEVPPEYHRTYRNSDTIPLFQMIAKNFGIRRARGELVLATNQDIVLSDGLIRFLASDEVDADRMYRLDRLDVPEDIPLGVPVDERLRWCEQNVIRRHRRMRSTSYVPSDSMATSTNLAQWLDRAGALLRYAAMRVRGGVHTNGCGDFTLLSRDLWHQLRGYPELHLFSMHLDSILCWQAYGAGAQQCILDGDRRAYHIEHHHSWANMDLAEKLKTFERKPWIDVDITREIFAQLSESGPVVFNEESWGGAGLDLAETWLLDGQKLRLSSAGSLQQAG